MHGKEGDNVRYLSAESVLINISRGEVVNEKDLYNALEEKLIKGVKTLYPKYQVRNKSLQKESAEYTFELRGKKDLSNKIDTLKDINGVNTVMLLTYKGDYVV